MRHFNGSSNWTLRTNSMELESVSYWRIQRYLSEPVNFMRPKVLLCHFYVHCGTKFIFYWLLFSWKRCFVLKIATINASLYRHIENHEPRGVFFFRPLKMPFQPKKKERKEFMEFLIPLSLLCHTTLKLYWYIVYILWKQTPLANQSKITNNEYINRFIYLFSFHFATFLSSQTIIRLICKCTSKKKKERKTCTMHTNAHTQRYKTTKPTFQHLNGWSFINSTKWKIDLMDEENKYGVRVKLYAKGSILIAEFLINISNGYSNQAQFCDADDAV